MRGEISRCGAHDKETGLEIAAGVGHFGIAMHGFEGAADVGVAAQISDADGEEADDRNNA